MNNLPELPKGKDRKEAKIDGRVADWFYKHHPRPVALEVKVTGGKLKEHQARFINKISKGLGFKYKFRDGSLRTPCDYIIFPKNSDADAVVATCEGNKCECEINNTYKINIKV